MRKPTAVIAAIAATFLLLTSVAPASAATIEDPVSLGVVGEPGAWAPESVAVGDLVYFTVHLDDSEEVWYTDGEAVSRIATFERAEDLVVFDGAVYLGARQDATHDGLWKVTTTGVTLVSPHDGTDVQPAVEELAAGDSELFYYTWGGEVDDSVILWSWSEDAGATELVSADIINDLYVVGDAAIFYVADEGTYGVWWWTPGAGAHMDYAMDDVEDVAVLGDSALLFGDGEHGYGLWSWDADNGFEFVEDLDYGDAFLELDDSIIVAGEADTHDGLWSWDGSDLAELDHEFLGGIYTLAALGDVVYFEADDGTDSGIWKLEGTTISYVVSIPDFIYGFEQFGNMLLLTIGDQLYSWDGSDAPLTPLGDEWGLLGDIRVADSYALVFNSDPTDGLEAWIVGMDALDSIELTPSSTTVTAGSDVTFAVEGFDSDGGSLGDLTAGAHLESAPAATSITGATIHFETTGTYLITATVGSTEDTAQVVVTPAGLSTLELGTTATGLIVGDTADFTVEGFDAYGNSLGDLASSATLSTVPASTTIGTGEITFDAAGTFEVTADVGGHQDQLALQVDPGDVESIELLLSAATVPVGGHVTFTVNGLNANGVAIDDLTASATVVSDHPTDEIVGNTITFPHASPHEITATAGQFQDVVVIEVTAAELGSTGVGPWWLGALAVLLLAGAGVVLLRVRRQH